MDFVIELVIELIFEGTVEAAGNPKVPKWLRICLDIILALFFLILFVGLILGAAECIVMKAWVGLAIFAILFFVVGFFVYKIIRKVRNRG